jgi:hypothetical protein
MFNERIQKFSSSGVFISKWGNYVWGDGQLPGTWGIAIDSSGNIFVTDSLNHGLKFFPKSIGDIAHLSPLLL